MSSAIRTIPHGPHLPVTEPDGNMKYSSGSEHSDMTVLPVDDASSQKMTCQFP